jgi:hypothetical protein
MWKQTRRVVKKSLDTASAFAAGNLETQYWLRMIVAANQDVKEQARTIWQEARELVLIFESIHRSSATQPK